MTRPVSVVMPALGNVGLLEKSLPPLLEEVGRRALDDEVIVVDDTGEDVLAAALGADFPTVRVVAREENEGFARALLAGVEAARHELVFSMNTDVIVRPGFLDPLVACIEDSQVFAVSPRILLDGDDERIESLTTLRLVGGMVEARHDGDDSRFEARPVPFAIGGACLLRRAAFLARKGFDSLYEPFYWEDVDVCFEAWRSGGTVLYQPASVVEHHHRATIGALVDEEVRRAAIEKNRLLFAWKFLDSDELLREHVAAVYRLAIDAWLADRHEELVWLDLALDQLDEALRSRKALGKAKRGFDEVLRLTSS